LKFRRIKNQLSDIHRKQIPIKKKSGFKNIMDF
jgi:hypothetical protein